MNSKTVCIIGAMDCEIKRLKSILTNVQELNFKAFSVFKGEIFDKTVVLVKSGVGKACAAACTQFLIDNFNPGCILNTGVAGGIANGLQIGDVIIATKLVYHDFDATAIGYAKGYICNNINPNEPTYFYTDENLVQSFEKAAKKTEGLNYSKGVIASGDMFVGSSEKKKEINAQFNAVAAEMEGAAIAHISTLNNVPFLIIRALCDLADEKAGKGHAFNEEESADISSRALEALLEIL